MFLSTQKKMSVTVRSLTGLRNLYNSKNVHFSIQSRTAASATRVIPSSDTKFKDLKPFSEIPGPRNFPLVGMLPTILFSRDTKFDIHKINDFWQSMAKKYGKIFLLKSPGFPMIVAIGDPDEIQNIYRFTMDQPIRDGFLSLKKIREEAVDNFFEKKGGLLVENRDEWWRVRSKVQAPMMKMKNIARYLPQQDEVNLLFIDRISTFQQQHGEMPENFQNEIYKWALESVGLVALNRRLGCLDPNLPADSIPNQLIDTVNVIFEALNETEMNIRWWLLYETKHLKILRKSHNSFLSIILEIIKETEADLQHKSITEDSPLIEKFLKTDGISYKDVLTIILDMFIAGIDTTSHTLGFTLYCLSRNKEAQKRLQAEVDTVLGDGQETITDAQLAKLSFLKCCVKESMRIFPIIVGSIRTLTQDTALSGYRIPKDVQVFSMGCVTSTSEDYFARPTEYLPERWQRDQPLGKIHPFASIPFSHGSRMCIGRRIAEQEMYSLLARMFHRFHVDYKYKDIGYITRLISVPSEPLKFEFTERKK